MYPPLNLKEIRHEYRQCNRGHLGLFQFGYDKPHAIAPFAQAESPPYLDSVRTFFAVCFLHFANARYAFLTCLL